MSVKIRPRFTSAGCILLPHRSAVPYVLVSISRGKTRFSRARTRDTTPATVGWRLSQTLVVVLHVSARTYPLPSHARRFPPLPTTTRAAALFSRSFFAALTATIGSCQTSILSQTHFLRACLQSCYEFTEKSKTLVAREMIPSQVRNASEFFKGFFRAYFAKILMKISLEREC